MLIRFRGRIILEVPVQAERFAWLGEALTTKVLSRQGVEILLGPVTSNRVLGFFPMQVVLVVEDAFPLFQMDQLNRGKLMWTVVLEMATDFLVLQEVFTKAFRHWVLHLIWIFLKGH